MPRRGILPRASLAPRLARLLDPNAILRGYLAILKPLSPSRQELAQAVLYDGRSGFAIQQVSSAAGSHPSVLGGAAPLQELKGTCNEFS
jgi:hypothetical protein